MILEMAYVWKLVFVYYAFELDNGYEDCPL